MVNSRTAIELLYRDFCTISENRMVKDEATHESKLQTVETVTMQPCRLSVKSISAASPADPVASVSQVVKLFIAPEIDIPEGSRIEVRRFNGSEQSFKSSGTPAVYSSHQEVIIEPVKSYA